VRACARARVVSPVLHGEPNLNFLVCYSNDQLKETGNLRNVRDNCNIFSTSRQVLLYSPVRNFRNENNYPELVSPGRAFFVFTIVFLRLAVL
jgi:hypothetical protein